MRLRSFQPLIALAALVAAVVFAAPAPAHGQRRGLGRRSSFYYSSPSNVFRGQLALEREGHLEKGKYEPGLYDPPTREAIRDFQRRHRLWSSGRFDRDTFAMLPIDDRPDKDDDGIPDADDRCPETEKRTRVGYDGCPLPEKTDSPTSSEPASDRSKD